VLREIINQSRVSTKRLSIRPSLTFESNFGHIRVLRSRGQDWGMSRPPPLLPFCPANCPDKVRTRAPMSAVRLDRLEHMCYHTGGSTHRASN
jgi:hypothetical protein